MTYRQANEIGAVVSKFAPYEYQSPLSKFIEGDACAAALFNQRSLDGLSCRFLPLFFCCILQLLRWLGLVETFSARDFDFSDFAAKVMDCFVTRLF